jgi:aldose 1-epimerase
MVMEKLIMLRVTAVLTCAFCFASAPLSVLHAKSKPNITKSTFGKTTDGQQADLYVLANKKGMQVAITNFGATTVSVKVPDRNGKVADVVLGYDDVKDYESGKAYFGATVGRYANRIAHGEFTLNGTTYTLAKNDGENHLHGGVRGFSKKMWAAKDVSTGNRPALKFTYVSEDGEEGYPGKLEASVTFTLTDKSELIIQYAAATDKATVINLTNHSYFNLAGQDSGDILSHHLTLYADKFTPVDATLIPTGELRNVKGTPFDFTRAEAIGTRINQSDQQLKFGKGYDHNWVLKKNKVGGLSPAAELYDAQSGRVVDVQTTEPGVQFYSGNFLDGTARGKAGKAYNYRTGLCLETQHFPDSPNHPHFPTTTLKPGERFRSTTIYAFSTK